MLFVVLSNTEYDHQYTIHDLRAIYRLLTS